jgi:hypothetical protein
MMELSAIVAVTSLVQCWSSYTRSHAMNATRLLHAAVRELDCVCMEIACAIEVMCAT